MSVLNIIFVSIFVAYVSSEEASTLKSCSKSDLKCINVLAKQFINGFPDYGVESSDPVNLPELAIQNSVITLTKVVVTGLKNMSVDDFQLYPDGSTLKISISAPLEIESDAFWTVADFLNPWYRSQLVSGRFKAKANIVSHIFYTIGVLARSGVDHYVIGPETIVAGVQGGQIGGLQLNGREITDAGSIDDIHLNTCIITQVTERVLSRVTENMRVATAKLPRRAFFFDL